MFIFTVNRYHNSSYIDMPGPFSFPDGRNTDPRVLIPFLHIFRNTPRQSVVLLVHSSVIDLTRMRSIPAKSVGCGTSTVVCYPRKSVKKSCQTCEAVLTCPLTAFSASWIRCSVSEESISDHIFLNRFTLSRLSLNRCRVFMRATTSER